MLLADIGYESHPHDKALKIVIDAKPQTIGEAVKLVTELYCRLYKIDPPDINEGMCADFASDVEKVFPGADPVWDDDLGGAGEHCFVSFRGKFYDSEEHEGVTRWKELPYFQR